MRVSEIDRSSTPLAEVAELVDALASGASELMLVEVQVLSSAPCFKHDVDIKFQNRLSLLVFFRLQFIHYYTPVFFAKRSRLTDYGLQ